MNHAFTVGVLLTVAGLAGYAGGVAVDYPGRALSLTLLMAGIALISMRRAFEDSGVNGD